MSGDRAVSDPAPSAAEQAPRVPLSRLLGSTPEGRERLGELRRLLARGGVLAVPTESSYGLAVDPRSAPGVKAVYRIKARDAGKPLPVVAADLDQVTGLGIDPDLPILARLAPLWPAALSLVLPLEDCRGKGDAAMPAAAGGGTLAVRIPAHAGLRRLLAALGRALTATSANVSGEPPVLDPGRAAELLAGRDAVVIDGGRLPGGAPSTLVVAREEMNPPPREVAKDVAGDSLGRDGTGGEDASRTLRVEILRPGRVPAERIRRALGRS